MRAIAKKTTIEDDAAPKRTPLTLLWAFCTLLWSIFTPPHKTFPARISLLQPLWAVRVYRQDAAWVQDLLLFLSLHAAYTYWTGAWRFLALDDLKWIDLHDHVTQIYLETFGLLAGCGGLAGGIVYRGHRMKAKDQSENPRNQSIDEQLLPPLLIPSRTNHSRLFPERHAFSYSYLFVGIPVGIKGAVGNALSIDTPRRKWFHVSSLDYLARGGTNLGLAEKLKRYLHAQGVTERDYAFAYLVTAPRFLGYSFNPVSFWYLYDSDAVLKYMILEVNNTFDERRVYLLNAGDAKHDTVNGEDRRPETSLGESPTKLVFTEVWDKDFHVSPFNSRKGSYSLRATDPLAAYEESGQVRIDNTIVLRSSKDSAKVVARVASEGHPREAWKVEYSELYRFIASWWWVGLATFPRIIWEAQKLFFQRKLHVWYRPEVTDSSIGRTYTEDERTLECFFHAFLKDVVERSKNPLRLIYVPAHTAGDEIVLYSPGFTYEEDQRKTLTLEVLSPAFYSRFVHYSHAKEAFDRECLATDDKNKTVTIKNANLLPLLLGAVREYEPSKPRHQGALDRFRWRLLRRLRCPPPDASYVHRTVSESEYDITDIRTFRDSELDAFVKMQCEDASLYRRIVTFLFLAQRITFGVPVLMSAIDWIFRTGLIFATFCCCNYMKHVDIMRQREFGPKETQSEDIWTLAGLILLANGIHIWSFLKGQT